MRETQGSSVSYFRVKDQSGSVLEDLLPEKRARLWQERWNHWEKSQGGDNLCTLVPLVVTEAPVATKRQRK